MADESPPDQPQAKTIQFRLSSIFVLTLIAGILAAFLGPRGNDLMLAGGISVVGTLLFSLLVGWLRPPLADRVFWGLVIAAMMQAVCAEVVLLDRRGIYAWPLAAGFAAVAASGNSNLYVRMLLAAVTSGLVIALYAMSLGVTTRAVLANVACAAIGGALLTTLIDVTKWIERKRHIPQPAIGLALVLVAIGFSVIAPRVIPGW